MKKNIWQLYNDIGRTNLLYYGDNEMIGLLKVLFYLMIGIPFIFMAYDVLFHIIKGMHRLFSMRLKPVMITALSAISRN
jgi:hypothetical protein